MATAVAGKSKNLLDISCEHIVAKPKIFTRSERNEPPKRAQAAPEDLPKRGWSQHGDTGDCVCA